MLPSRKSNTFWAEKIVIPFETHRTLEGILFPYHPPAPLQHIMRSEMVGVSVFGEFRKATLSSAAGPGGYRVQLSIAIKCSLCCLFITALGISRKTILLWGFILLLFVLCSVALLFL